MLDQFEFWTIKEGEDSLTRIGVRVSGEGRHASWLVATDDAEADVLKRWARRARRDARLPSCVGAGVVVRHGR
jgi:hypothetical protein